MGDPPTARTGGEPTAHNAFSLGLRGGSPVTLVQRISGLGALVLGSAALAIGFAVRVGLDPLLESRATYIFFVPGVVAAAVGGFWPALAATALGAAAGIAADAITGEVLFGDALAAAVFLLMGFFIALGGGWLRRVREREAATTRDLAQREAHLTSILRTVPDAMIVIDEAGLIRDFSNTAERQFGWSADEVTGKNVSMLMPSPYRDQHDQYL